LRELKIRHSRFRLRRHAASPFLYVREMAGGRKVNEFSLQPKSWCKRDDIEEARDLCIQGHRQRSWPAPQTAATVATGPGWSELVKATEAKCLKELEQENARLKSLFADAVRIRRCSSRIHSLPGGLCRGGCGSRAEALITRGCNGSGGRMGCSSPCGAGVSDQGLP